MEEASKAVELDSDDDFEDTPVENIGDAPPTSTPSVKAAAPPLSSEVTGSPATVGVPAEFLVRTVAANTVRSISDASIAPKAYTGKTEQDAEEWFEYFERYAEFRKLLPPQKRELFSLLMRDRAADWLLTLPKEDSATYARLVEAFKKNYFRSPELRWREAEELWATTQDDGERIDDYVCRLKKKARRLGFAADVLHLAVLRGMRGATKLHVLTQGSKNAGGGAEGSTNIRSGAGVGKTRYHSSSDAAVCSRSSKTGGLRSGKTRRPSRTDDGTDSSHVGDAGSPHGPGAARAGKSR
jgi:hypothetical protein